MTAERALALLRDAGCILLALGGIAHQQLTGQVNAELLVVYTGLLGVPTYINLRAIKPPSPRRSTGSSSRSVSGSLSGPSSSSPSTSPGGEG